MLLPFVLAAALGATVVVLGAAGGPEQHNAGAGAPVVDQATVTRDGGGSDSVPALLDRRAQALRAGDRAAFLATVDEKVVEFRAAQARWFDNLRAVPFDGWTLRPAPRAARSMIPQGARDRVAGTAPGSFAAVVEGEFRIAGHDNAGMRYDRALTLTPRAGRWYVSGSFDLVGRAVHRELWDVGRVNVRHAEHGLILGLEPRERLARYAAELDRAVPAVTRVWGKDWPRKALIQVTRTEAEMAQLLGGAPQDYLRLAAVTRGELGLSDGGATAERIIVNPRAYRELSPAGRRVIMRHEVAHVAARSRTQSSTPRWLAEGFADYVGYRDAGLSTEVVAQELAADLRRGMLPSALPADAEFSAASPNLPQSYELSWLAARLIAERYGGAPALVDLYRSVGAPDGGVELDVAMREVLGVDMGEFTRAWRDFVSAELS